MSVIFGFAAGYLACYYRDEIAKTARRAVAWVRWKTGL